LLQVHSHGLRKNRYRVAGDRKQIEILQGLVELYQGDLDSAIERFEELLETDPDNVVANSLFAVTFAHHSNWSEYYRICARLGDLPVATADDYLYRGYAESMESPGQALRSLDEAVQRRPTSQVTRFIRLETRTLYLIQEKADLDQVELVMEDAKLLKTIVANNPHVLVGSLMGNLSAANVALIHNDTDLQATALAAVRMDFDALAAFQDSPEAVTARLMYQHKVPGEDNVSAVELLKDAHRIAQERQDFGATYACATIFIVMENLRRPKPFSLSTKAILLPTCCGRLCWQNSRMVCARHKSCAQQSIAATHYTGTCLTASCCFASLAGRTKRSKSAGTI
jgi:tetratricopeptide (TPR) repeat protein